MEKRRQKKLFCFSVAVIKESIWTSLSVCTCTYEECCRICINTLNLNSCIVDNLIHALAFHKIFNFWPKFAALDQCAWQHCCTTVRQQTWMENDCAKFPQIFFSLNLEARSERNARLLNFSLLQYLSQLTYLVCTFQISLQPLELHLWCDRAMVIYIVIKGTGWLTLLRLKSY